MDQWLIAVIIAVCIWSGWSNWFDVTSKMISLMTSDRNKTEWNKVIVQSLTLMQYVLLYILLLRGLFMTCWTQVLLLSFHSVKTILWLLFHCIRRNPAMKRLEICQNQRTKWVNSCWFLNKGGNKKSQPLLQNIFRCMCPFPKRLWR